MRIFLSAVFPVLEMINNHIKYDVVLPGQTTLVKIEDPVPGPWVYITIGAVMVIIIVTAVMVIKLVRNLKSKADKKESK